jgi:hypothetical protein
MSAEAKSAKIELKGADFSFFAEGDPEWIAAQLDKVLASLAARAPAKPK